LASVRLRNASPYGALDVELLRVPLGRTVVEAGEEFDVPAEIAAQLGPDFTPVTPAAEETSK